MDRNSLVANAQKYIQRGQLDRAIEAYRKLLEQDPSDVRLLLKIADLEARAGKQAEAIASYRDAAEQFISRKFLFKALAVYKQLEKLAPDDLDVRLRLADLHVEVSLAQDAAKIYHAVIRELERDGKLIRAIDVMGRLVRIEPDDTGLQIRLAELYARVQDTAAAADIMIDAAARLARENRHDEYVRLGERILAWKPGHVETLRGLAHAQLALGEPRKAVARAQEAMRVAPRDIDTLRVLVDALKALGEAARAMTLLDGLERQFSGDEQEALVAAIAELRERLDQPETASDPNGGAPDEDVAGAERLLEEVAVYRKYGLADKALAHIDRALALAPGHAPAWILRAEILEAQSDTDGAQQARQRAQGGAEPATFPERTPTPSPETPAPAPIATSPPDASAEDVAIDIDPADLAAELRQALEAVSASLPDNPDDARSGLLQLLGDWPSEAEFILRLMEHLADLPAWLAGGRSADEGGAVIDLDAVEFEPVDALDEGVATGVAGPPDEPRAVDGGPGTDAEDEGMDPFAFLDPDDDLGSASVDSEPDDEDLPLLPVDALEVDEDLPVLAVDAPEAEGAGFAGAELAPVDAPIGRPSSAVDLVFTFSQAVLDTAPDSDLAEAIRQRYAGSGMAAMGTLEEEVFGVHTVCASFELAAVQLEMGLYIEASQGLDGIARVPGLEPQDHALLHYLRGVCMEGLDDTDGMREAFAAVSGPARAHFPDIPARLERAGLGD